MSTNTLGNGFVERSAAPRSRRLPVLNPASNGLIAGQLIRCRCSKNRAPRGWGGSAGKNQHASLLVFASDAYLNEMGITNRFNLTENTSMGDSVAGFDNVPDDTPCESATPRAQSAAKTPRAISISSPRSCGRLSAAAGRGVPGPRHHRAKACST
jgi:hypothetical protein